MEKAGFFELSTKEQTTFATSFEDQFGFPLSRYLSENQRTLVRRDEKVFIFPRLLLEQFSSLPVQSAGMQICSIENEVLLPTFEWGTRFGARCELSKMTLSPSETSEWLSGRDLSFPDQSGTKTSIYLVFNEEDQFLGRGKSSQYNLKNLDYRRYQ